MKKDRTFFSLLGAVSGHLSSARKVQLALLSVLMVLGAFAEVLGLGAVIPFIGALTSPDSLLKEPWIADLAQRYGVTAGRDLVLPITLLFAATAIGSAVIRIAMVRANTALAYSIGADLGIEIYQRTLYQPYEVHIGRNSSEVISGVTRKVDGVVTGVLLPILTLCSSLLLFISIVGALFWIDWQVALIACVVFGSCYGFTTFAVRRKLKANSRRISREQTLVFQSLQEGLAGIRDVLVSGTQEHYSRLYRDADIPLRRAQGDNSFISQFPRYAMEALGMVLIAALAYFLVSKSGTPATDTLAVLAVFALGGQRMLPALQQGYAAWSTVMGSMGILVNTVDLLEQPLDPADLAPPPPALLFKNEIRLENVGFRYATAEGPTIAGIDLIIRQGARVGIIGQTGAGKSTLVDMLMGLLTPTSGQMRVDGRTIDRQSIRAWQQNIAHVPQRIYLSDGSFAQNIALGELPEAIDLARVKRAAEQAQIADFIENQPGGYAASTGENGVRLSGGQRQRIGIARALYRDAAVLIFDEATSALDSATEQSVIEAISGLRSDLTIIMIAHRLSTLANCDLIVELDAGRVTRTGSYADIIADASPSEETVQGSPAAPA